jgi:hypothetical protein
MSEETSLASSQTGLSKWCRSRLEDALTGIIYHDDAQIVQIEAYKFYELPERVEIEVGKPELPLSRKTAELGRNPMIVREYNYGRKN